MKIFNSFLLWQLIIIGALVISGSILSITISENIKISAIKRTETIYSDFIIKNIDEQLDRDNFKSINLESSQNIFESFFEELDNPEIIGIKVWGNDSTILFSNNDSIIGLKILDNPRHTKALNGEIVTILRDYSVEEKLTTKTIDQVMAIYVPIFYASDIHGDNEVYGVVETYIDPTFLNISISNTTTIVYVIIGMMVLFVSIIIMINFQTHKKSIIEPIKRIEKLTNDIPKEGFKNSNVNANASEEIKNLTDNILQMISSIYDNDKLIREEKLSSIGELSASIAHDIRNPLSVIRNDISIIENELINPDRTVKDAIKRTHRAISRIDHQIQNVLDFIKNKPIVKVSTRLDLILKSVIDSFVLSSGININQSVEDMVVNCDPIQIESVFSNIIFNAIQTMGKNGTLDIRLHSDNKWIKIEFSDTGPGIPKEKLTEIFEPLYTTKQEGTGLGLTSCKSIVKSHDGEINVRNNADKGVTFTVKLPKDSIP